MHLEFSGELWFWRGPAPWHFVTVPDDGALALKAIEGVVTYGWGMIPATVRIGGTEWTTSLWPKDGSYVVPVKAWVREAEALDIGDTVEAHGVTGYSIFRRIGDPSHLLVTLDFDTAEHAQAFREALRPVWEISGAGRSWVIDG